MTERPNEERDEAAPEPADDQAADQAAPEPSAVSSEGRETRTEPEPAEDTGEAPAEDTGDDTQEWRNGPDPFDEGPAGPTDGPVTGGDESPAPDPDPEPERETDDA